MNPRIAGEDEKQMESEGATPGTRAWRELTTGKQYFPGYGNKPGTTEEEATGGRTRPAQEKKQRIRNGYVILYMRVWFLCHYEVTNKDELLQEIYIKEEEKSPPDC